MSAQPQWLGAWANVESQLGNVALQMANVLSWLIAGLAGALFIGFVALYVLTGPSFSRRWHERVFRFLPQGLRGSAGNVLGSLASTLRGWLLGRFISMIAVGVATTIGLWLLKIPYAVMLGLVAGMLGLIPNIGPLLAAVPAAVFAFTVSPMHVLYVLGLYLGINLAEGFLLSPWLDKRTVGVPPALAIVGQLVAGALGGLLGMVLATPIIALAMLLLQKLRRHDNALSGGDKLALPRDNLRPQR